MCCSGDGSGGSRSARCALLCGLAALAAIGVTIFSTAWIQTEERITSLPRNVSSLVSIKFKIGFWHACSSINKPVALQYRIDVPTGCIKIPYKNFNDINETDLGFKHKSLDFAPLVIMQMRVSMVYQVIAGFLVFVGVVTSICGSCCKEILRMLISCACFLLGGLSLAFGLITLVSDMSEILWLTPVYVFTSGNSTLPQYQYGWCLQLSALAFILAKLAAILTVSGYMARFPTVEDMVRDMVPGAERKLREQLGLSSEYLVRSHQKSPGPTPCTGVNQPTKGSGPPRLAEEGTSLLCKSAPDICASNPQSAISYVDKADLSHMLPAYPETKVIEPRFAAPGFPEKTDQNVVDSRLSGFVDKEGLIMDSRMLSESRQNVIAFAEGKEHPNCQEPPARFSDFPPPPEPQQQLVQPSPSVQQQPPLAFADKEPPDFTGNEQQSIVDSLLDAPYGYDTRYNSLAGQTVPITLKHHHQQQLPSNSTVAAMQSNQYHYQNFGTIHSGMLRVAEPGTSSTSSNCSSQRSMTLQNPKRKATANAQIAQNTFSTLECERRRRGGGGGVGGNAAAAMQVPGKANFCAGSAV
ncbi:uncharacterized protein LOC106645364 [Copidosoma floridanum]|uniref:uncharacterized protein LOC106645364 n=1 Tax=Copidosoma floridanum TaxID=29053 RepID=UPI000C6F7125|nr:uncharacterized protein LOC106645364 [Copidosoma floridanum]